MHLVFVNGHFSADLSDAESADPVRSWAASPALERGDPAVLAALSESDPDAPSARSTTPSRRTAA